MINITFPDGNVRQYESGTSALDIAKSISHGLAKKVLSANVNGEIWDATRPINKDANIQLFTFIIHNFQITYCTNLGEEASNGPTKSA